MRKSVRKCVTILRIKNRCMGLRVSYLQRHECTSSCYTICLVDRYAAAYATMDGTPLSGHVVALAVLACFVSPVTLYVLRNFNHLFLNSRAWKHRLSGLLLFAWQLVGLLQLSNSSYILQCIPYVEPKILYLAYDVVLGLLGTLTTLTAAFDFKKGHARVKNYKTGGASGTLDDSATVKYSEMIEHSFYQLLNLVQVCFIHSFTFMGAEKNLTKSSCLAIVATLPWVVRDRFPINPFSANYTKGQNPRTLVAVLYRIKKYQYIFYKHFLLHGLNVSIALSFSSIGQLLHFRLYWWCLNVSYVMEFFLQTLVKKNYMGQTVMLTLQQVLMLASSIAAFQVLGHVYLLPVFLSLFLNLTRRKKEMSSFVICLVVSRLVLENSVMLLPALMAVISVVLFESAIHTMLWGHSEDLAVTKME